MDPFRAQLGLTFGAGTAGRTRLLQRRIAYPFFAAAPILATGGAARLVVQSISGGLYGGERLSQSVIIEREASAEIFMPAATPVRRRGNADCVEQTIELSIAESGRLAYLARPHILFPGAVLRQNIRITLAPGAQCLITDGFLDHHIAQDPWSYTSAVRVETPDGRLLAAERTALAQPVLDAAYPGSTGSFRAFGKLWYLGLGADEQSGIVARAVDEFPAGGTVAAGASRLPGDCGVVIAFAAQDGGMIVRAVAHACKWWPE